MSQNDLTSDMLTRVRNAVRNNARRVRCLDNKLNRGVLEVLRDEGFITGFEPAQTGSHRYIEVDLKYGPRGERIINTIDRTSRPGCRVYSSVQDLPRPMQGLGIAIVSTSQGVLSDRACRDKSVGGEVIATVT